MRNEADTRAELIDPKLHDATTLEDSQEEFEQSLSTTRTTVIERGEL